jgi:hypothetical protein
MVVRAAVVRTLVRSALGLVEWEMGGRDGCDEEGRAPRTFIESEGGAGRPDGEGDRAAGAGGINAGRLVRWGGETGGEWGVKRGECSAVSGRGGVIGAAAAPGRASRGRRRSGRLTGWARLSVRGRRRGRLGQKGREGDGLLLGQNRCSG